MKSTKQIWDKSLKQVEMQVGRQIENQVVSQSVAVPLYIVTRRIKIELDRVLKEING